MPDAPGSIISRSPRFFPRKDKSSPSSLELSRTILADVDARVIAVGWGMSGTVSRADLLDAEAIFAASGPGTDVDLCAYADASALEALAKGGYVVSGLLNVYARVLSDEDLAIMGQESSEVQVVGVTPDRVEEFIHVSASGFASWSLAHSPRDTRPHRNLEVRHASVLCSR